MQVAYSGELEDLLYTAAVRGQSIEADEDESFWATW